MNLWLKLDQLKDTTEFSIDLVVMLMDICLIKNMMHTIFDLIV
jgi:hypothetical protein